MPFGSQFPGIYQGMFSCHHSCHIEHWNLSKLWCVLFTISNILLMGLKMFKFIKALSDTVFNMINAVHYDKPLTSIRATFLEKLLSHHQAVKLILAYLWPQCSCYLPSNLLESNILIDNKLSLQRMLINALVSSTGLQINHQRFVGPWEFLLAKRLVKLVVIFYLIKPSFRYLWLWELDCGNSLLT